MSNIKVLTPRQLDRRQRILSSAREMIADHGYDGMVMSQIAAAAGVSPTTLYNLFNTKDQLILSSLQDFLLTNAQNRFNSAGGPGWRYMLDTVIGGARLTAASPAYSEAMLTALQRSKSGDQLVRLLIEDGCQNFSESLSVMLNQNELRADIDINNLAVMLVGSYWSSFFMWNKGVLRLTDLEKSVLASFVAILLPHTKGLTRVTLQKVLDQSIK